MWTAALPILKKFATPSNIAIVVLLICCGWLWVENQFRDAQVTKLKAEITEMKADHKEKMGEIKDAHGACIGSVEELEDSQGVLKIRIKSLEALVGAKDKELQQCLDDSEEQLRLCRDGKNTDPENVTGVADEDTSKMFIDSINKSFTK